MFDKNEILTLLHGGKSVDAIGQEFADLLNQANAEFEATKKANMEAKEKEDLAKQILFAFNNYIVRFYPEVAEQITLTNEDVDTVIKSLDEIFGIMKSLTKILPEQVIRKNSDDMILSGFLKDFNLL